MTARGERRAAGRRTRQLSAALLLAACCSLLACTGELPSAHLSKDPISLRGWIADVEQRQDNNTFRTVETESARRAQLFQGTNIWVENAPYVSGGVAETGAFLLLDVPPGNITVDFTPPGGQNVRLVMQNIPGNADVLIPALLLKPNGTVALLDPKAVKVRLAANIDKPRPTSLTAIIAGVSVPVIEVPIAEMVDRRDYPNAPATTAPVATVK
ncbi:MAG TPA: hypothetical protein VGR02_12455 [Thermoanaerobaculia bacterium]|jgi:hypothetical protein|nr:hypothetical protein [Thermoanaerobaculia bacterium]